MHVPDRIHRDVEKQGHYARRIGESIALPSDDAGGFIHWRIVDVVRGDDDAPVVLQEVYGTKIMTISAARLHRFETAMRDGAVPEHTARVIAVEDIPGHGVVMEAGPVLDVLERLRHREMYTPESVIASAFPEEIDAAVRVAYAA